MHSAPLVFALLLSLSSQPAALVAGMSAQPPDGGGDPGGVIRQQAKLHIARNGQEMVASWELPPMELRSLELIRNTQREPKGRDRVATVSKKSLQYVDVVPDASATYWYWLKITLKDGRTVGVGPVSTPGGEVWSPAK